jgi:Protein of unknown function (DUF3149)
LPPAPGAPGALFWGAARILSAPAQDGLLSAAVIAITLGMGVFDARFFQRHIREDSEAAARLARTH